MFCMHSLPAAQLAVRLLSVVFWCGFCVASLRAAEALHVVVPGDTLYAIARTHRISVEQLQQLNRLPGSLLRVGQTLRLPSRLGAATPAASGAGVIHFMGACIETHTIVPAPALAAANREILASVQARAPWAQSEVHIALHLAGHEAATLLIRSEGEHVEANRRTVVTLLLQGLADDAVNGHWHEFAFKKVGEPGVWQLTAWRRANLSARAGASPNYQDLNREGAFP